VSAVVSVVILLTIIPVVLAARLAGAGAVTRSARDLEVGESGRCSSPPAWWTSCCWCPVMLAAVD
jgi:hypothetical protein